MERALDSFRVASDDHHLFLALAALFEADFSIDWIVALTRAKASQVLAVLENGAQNGLLLRREPGIYCFSNSEKKQWWQNRVTEEEKTRFNASTAKLLMMEFPDVDDKASKIAHHLLQIVNDWQGCDWLVAAGDFHIKRFNTEKAVQCYTKVISDLRNQKGDKEDFLFISAAIEYSNISAARHDIVAILSVLHDAMTRAEEWDFRKEQALLRMHMAKNELLRSRYDTALKYFEDGLSMANELADPALVQPLTMFSTFFLFWQGRFREVIQAYEKSRPDVEKYPLGQFPLLAAIMVGRAYTVIGQFAQGLGMLDTIREHCRKSGNIFMASHSEAAIGITLLDSRRIEDALFYLKSSLEGAKQSHNYWAKLMVRFTLALAYYLKGEENKCISNLRKFLKHSKQVHVSLQLFPYLMEICWAMEESRLPQVAGLSLEKELGRMLQSKNTFIKGVAYRFRALLQERQGMAAHAVEQSLKLSLNYLGESGHEIELAKSQIELGRHYLSIGENQRGEELIALASNRLYSINPSLVPDQLRSFVKDQALDDNLLKEILGLGSQLVSLKDNKKRFLQIISAVNRITGAERGAIFLLSEERDEWRLQMRASKNLTSEQVHHQSFQTSRKMIEEVTVLRTGRILGMDSDQEPDFLPSDIIRSRICAPIIFGDKVNGVLYHDNRLLSNLFRDRHLEILNYFAAIAALELEVDIACDEIRRLQQQQKEKNLDPEESKLEHSDFEEIIGDSYAIKHVLAQVQQVARTDTTVLIYGETGVGKDLIARAIHSHSDRHNKPFVRVHCSALPETLITSELFGHERGAFTGANHRRIGRFELAHGGTLFLDEIGDLPIEVQVRLLRVLQNKEFERVGGGETLRSDFRLLAATNRLLEQDVKSNRFRADLFYRINVFPISVPPLRERKEDIPLLAQHFLTTYGNKIGKNMNRLSDDELQKIIDYDWPGNIRELQNLIERGVILSRGPYMRVPNLRIRQNNHTHWKGFNTLKEQERLHVIRALERTGWKLRGPGGAAELLDINPSTLASRMKKLGIRRSDMYNLKHSYT